MQRLGKHRIKAGIVEPDTELLNLLRNGSGTFPRQHVPKHTVLTDTRNWTPELVDVYAVGRK
jgi:hypothetical protein